MSLSHVLLGLLADRPASGYDLLKRFEISLANVWPARQSQIYTELGRLAEGGLIEVAAEGPRGRKDYALTEAGLTELRRWLTETKPKKTRRNEAMMRVFFLDVLTKDQAVAYLTGMATQAAQNGEQLKALEESIGWDDSGLAVYGHLALEWGLRNAAMQREWAQWAADKIASAGPRRELPGPQVA
jgi:PadR family transcriptional regulator, regulatory protein AphA